MHTFFYKLPKSGALQNSIIHLRKMSISRKRGGGPRPLCCVMLAQEINPDRSKKLNMYLVFLLLHFNLTGTMSSISEVTNQDAVSV